jgi:hypothetical protein
VADALPAELVRIIEVLNEQTNPAEVLGVELRQYVGGGHTAYVPRVVGRTSMAVAAKATGVGQQWTEDRLLDAARARRPGAEAALIERLVNDVHERGVKLGWGKGVTPGVSGWYGVAGQPAAVWNLNVNADTPNARAYLYVYLADLVSRVPADTVEQAAQVLESLPGMGPKMAVGPGQWVEQVPVGVSGRHRRLGRPHQFALLRHRPADRHPVRHQLNYTTEQPLRQAGVNFVGVRSGRTAASTVFHDDEHVIRVLAKILGLVVRGMPRENHPGQPTYTHTS